MTILEKYLKNNPNCKTIEDYGKYYPVNKTNDDILCAIDAGLIDYCPITDFQDCRDCWNMTQEDLNKRRLKATL